jgi:hypothetical protein
LLVHVIALHQLEAAVEVRFHPAIDVPQTVRHGASVWSVAVGDFNGDGIPDVAVTNNGPETVSVLLGNGDGTFQLPERYAAGDSRSLAAGDFNGDGILDLVVVGQSDTASATALSIGDLNGDGKVDLAVASTVVSILLGNGDGTFQAPQNYAVGDSPMSIAVRDFNGDGHLDLAVAKSSYVNGPDYPTGTVSILLGKGDGTFLVAPTYAAGANPSSLAVGDFNGDGKPDLVLVNNPGATGKVSIFLGNGDGTFHAANSYAVGINASSVAVGDFNGDGILDLAVANERVSVLLGNGDGTFQTAKNYPAGG